MQRTETQTSFYSWLLPMADRFKKERLFILHLLYSLFTGRAKSNDAVLKTYSLRCDQVADAWEVFPDDKSKPIQFHFDPGRRGKSSIVVFSNPATSKWETSFWDFFQDESFEVIGRHEDGKLRPT